MADKAVGLDKYQANLKVLGKKLAQNIDEGILTQGRAFSDSIDNLISAMNKHTSTPYPAYAGLGKLDDVGKTADKFEDWYSSVKKSMMKTDSTGGSGVKVSGPVDELNPKALNEAGEQIAKGKGKADELNSQKIDDIINEIGDSIKKHPLRQEYESVVENLSNYETELRMQGLTEKEIAQAMH